ncbi:unnamed protein product [Fusarium equiseti]|uniref:Aminoglycoside phosphotransferase domain-containing protein n=1 Tax=Fusarium equiseti TaxID=61235 RepID=A0A8J2NGC5_FUSEQ|nr:unnamed protein product [Fusarium equiseti]
MAQSSRAGLLWDDSGICTKPIWEYEPKVEDIVRIFLRLGFALNRNQLQVSVLGQGAINKAYLVQIRKAGNETVLVMRLSLPIDPGNKTRGEVATLQWLRRYTTLPVPEVIRYTASPDDDLGFEWIIMSHVPGQPAFIKWRKMSMCQKKRLVEQIASYQHEITARLFETIGTLQLTDIIVMDFEQAIDEEDLDKVERFLVEGYLGITKRLRELIPTLFSDTTRERTVLWHHDLSLTNMIIGGDYNLNGIVDWECVSTVPFWAATGPPSFLRGRDRHEAPDSERYYHGDVPPVDKWGRDNDGRSTKYWDDLMDYEMTVLRAHYDSCRRHHDRGWKKDLTKEEKLKYDFLDAINLCRAQDFGSAVDGWLDELEDGKIIPLEYSD